MGKCWLSRRRAINLSLEWVRINPESSYTFSPFGKYYNLKIKCIKTQLKSDDLHMESNFIHSPIAVVPMQVSEEKSIDWQTTTFLPWPLFACHYFSWHILGLNEHDVLKLKDLWGLLNQCLLPMLCFPGEHSSVIALACILKGHSSQNTTVFCIF